MIKPTIGRVVWLHTNGAVPGFFKVGGDSPFAALVAYVHSDTLVNLSVADHAGQHWAFENVELWHGDGDPPAGGRYCDALPEGPGGQDRGAGEAHRPRSGSMRLFYFDEGPIDTLLQIAAGPTTDYNLVSKGARDVFVQLDWVARCHGWNIITAGGTKAIHALALRRTPPQSHSVGFTEAVSRATTRSRGAAVGPLRPLKARGAAMSLEATEKECAANAVAPRVSLADIEAAIEQVFWFTADQAIGEELSGHWPQLRILTVCLVVMRNGFTVIGKSAPASPANFNPELGRKLAHEDAVRQLWPLMGYALRDKLAAAR